MEKIKIIDILNKIANGEEVSFRTLFDDNVFTLTEGCNLYNETVKKEVRWWIDEDWLNEEVEIIEEDKKIEKLELQDDGNTITLFGKNENEWTILNNVDVLICDKINEIIEVINERTL